MIRELGGRIAERVTKRREKEGGRREEKKHINQAVM